MEGMDVLLGIISARHASLIADDKDKITRIVEPLKAVFEFVKATWP